MQRVAGAQPFFLPSRLWPRESSKGAPKRVFQRYLRIHALRDGWHEHVNSRVVPGGLASRRQPQLARTDLLRHAPRLAKSIAEGLGVVVAAIKHMRDVHDPTLVIGAYRALLKVDDDTRSDAARWTA